MAKRILLIYSLTEELVVMKKFLDEMGFRVKICDPMTDVVDFAANFHPDMIILGADLPVFSGIELTRMLKSSKKVLGVPCILVSYRKPTALDLSGTRQSAEPDDYLTIPVTKMNLFSTILKWLGDDALKTKMPPDTPDPAPAPDAKEADALKSANRLIGKVSPYAIGRVLCHMQTFKAGSCLRVMATRKKMKVTVAGGLIVDVVSNYVQEESLGRALLKKGLISHSECEAVHRRATAANVKYGEMVVRLGLISAAELSEAIKRQQEYKAFSLFSSSWHGGTYEAREEPVSLAGEDSLNISIGVFLRRSLLEKKFFPASALEHFQSLNQTALNLTFTKRLYDVVRWLELGSEYLELIKEMEGKTLDELKKKGAPNYNTMLRLAFLLAVSDVLDFQSVSKNQAVADKLPPAPPVPPKESQPVAKETRPVPREMKPVPKETKPVIKETKPPAMETVPRQTHPETHGELGDFMNVGIALFKDGNFRAALQVFQKACALDNNSSIALAYCALAEYHTIPLSDLEKIEKIKQMLKRAIGLDDTNFMAHLYLGKILKSENQDSQAEHHFRTAYQLSPANEEVLREVQLIEIKHRTQRDRGFYRE